MIEVKHNFPKLADTIRLFSEETGKAMPDVLAKEGREFSWELYQQFKAIPPGNMARAANLVAAAKARNFAMGRITDSLTFAIQGISAAAWSGAKSLLAGQKSGYFRVATIAGSGAPRLLPARFGGKSHRLLVNRKGRYAASAVSASSLSGSEFARERAANPDIKHLNLRAVAVANEIRLRSMAAKGATMAVQWLPVEYKTRKSSTVKNGPLITRSDKTGALLGQVDFVEKDGQLAEIQLKGKVPGTAEVFERYDIGAKVEAARVADRYVYLTRKLNEAAKKAGIELKVGK